EVFDASIARKTALVFSSVLGVRPCVRWCAPPHSRSCSMPDLTSFIRESLTERFGEQLRVGDDLSGLDGLARIAAHRVHRRYTAQDVAPDLLRLLCACALSAPSKSDLQQGGILVIRDKAKRDTIAG